MPRSCDPQVWYHMTMTTKKWPLAVILKSSVACASCAVRGFLIPHMFNLLKVDNVAKIFEVCSETAEAWVSVLVSNGYPSSFVQKITKARTTPRREPNAELKSNAVLPYVQGVSESLRRCLEQQGIRTVFTSDTTLRPHLVRLKDTVNPTKQDGVLYRIPCECGRVYIGKTGKSMQERIKEHDRYIRLARTQTSAVSEHTHETGHYPIWNEVKFIDGDPN